MKNIVYRYANPMPTWTIGGPYSKVVMRKHFAQRELTPLGRELRSEIDRGWEQLGRALGHHVWSNAGKAIGNIGHLAYGA